MPRREKAGFLSFEAYKELEYFCYQYRQKKQELAEAAIKTHKKMNLAQREQQSSVTAKQNELRSRALKAQLRIIEEAAEEAGRQLAPFLLKNVTEKIRYEYMEVPCGRRQFYEMRRKFFLILYEKKRGLEKG